MRSTRRNLMAGLALALAAPVALAAVDAGQAAKLGKELTPVGGDKAANADGTIPVWNGGITQPPANYRPGQFHPDPFAADTVQFTITPANYNDHAAKLTEGQKALFKKYRTFSMPVYPTRRSASYPQRTYEYTAKNATACKLVANGEGV